MSLVTDNVTDANNVVVVQPENILCDNPSQLGHKIRGHDSTVTRIL
jgi:hypothetical protein